MCNLATVMSFGYAPTMPRRNVEYARRIGRAVNALREARGWTMDELAVHSALSKSSIVRYEKGDAVPQGASLFKLAQTLGVSADLLLNPPEDREAVIGAAVLDALDINDPEIRRRMLERARYEAGRFEREVQRGDPPSRPSQPRRSNPDPISEG